MAGWLRAFRGPGRIERLQKGLLARGREGAVDIQTLRTVLDPRRPFWTVYCTDVCEPLGSGAFGEVFKTVHKASGTACAVKVVSKARVKAQGDDMICNEIWSLVELDHPHVARLMDFFDDGHSIYLVTELSMGGDLHEVVAEVGAPDYSCEVVRVFRQLMLAVSYCHARGVCHRDLKVENCLLSDPESRLVKVIDFGFAAIRAPSAPDHGWLREAVGTPLYMAPEVIDHKSSYGTKCDIWSAGVILYMLLTAEHPFVEAGAKINMRRLFQNVRHGKLLEAPLQALNVSSDARDLLRGMLAKDAHDRSTAAFALQHRWLRGALQTPVLPATPSGRCERRKLARRFWAVGKITRLEKAILTLTAHQACENELAELRQVFKALDRDGDGLVSWEAVEEACEGCGVSASAADLRRLFECFDSRRSGKLSYTTWLAATLRPEALATERAVKAAFDFFAAEDKRGTRAISKAELLRLLGEEDAQSALQQWDRNGDGTLDEDEFRALVENLARRRQVLELSPASADPTSPGSGASPTTPVSRKVSAKLLRHGSLQMFAEVLPPSPCGGG